MIIRKAKLADLEACVRIAHTPELTSLYNASKKEGKSYLQAYVTKGVFLVAEDKKQILGFIFGELMIGGYVWLDAIFVRKELRGQGIGHALLCAFKAQLKKRHIRNFYLMAPTFNKKTIRFYEREGFKKGKTMVEFSLHLRS